ncbi:MAG: ribonuclease R [Gammaproteobacteria bacterium]
MPKAKTKSKSKTKSSSPRKSSAQKRRGSSAKKSSRSSSREPHQVSIPERKAILAYLKKSGAPRQLEEIAKKFGTNSAAEKEAMSKRLRAMSRDGQVVVNRREGYGLLDKMDLIAGKIIAHPDGYGFVRPDEGGEDLYLSMREMRKVLHRDHVVVREGEGDRRGRRDAIIVETIESANKTVVGKYYSENSIGFLVPDNRRIHQDILIPADKTMRAKKGNVVVAEITRQPDRHTQPIGRIIEILGSTSSIDMAVDIALRAYDVPHDWPDAVMQEAGALPGAVKLHKGRHDLRDLKLVTIDGADAQDYDDAVYCERKGKGWRLIVAIADVSHYVRPDSELDSEAERRGNSVYFPGRVVPMLPERLSNDLCSLRPEVERYALACEMTISSSGKIKQSEFYAAVIRSAARLTYDEVNQVINDKGRHTLQTELHDLHTLYQLMHGRRVEQGMLDFSTTETNMEFNADGKVAAIRPVIRQDAHRLIEEFMLAANICAAEWLLQAKVPVLFRNHDTPAEEKINDLNQFLGDVGLQLGGGLDPKTRDYARVMELIETRDDKHLIETVLLRSMPLAVYEAKNKGHFGLAFEAYTHFTSPIRRYPDLIVHRAIRSLVEKGIGYRYKREDMHRLGTHTSMTERRADEATRDVTQRMKCEFMLDKIGNSYQGTVSGVTGFGLFVEIDDVYVEGLLHVTSLPRDYYHFDPVAHSLTGEAKGKRYYLGDRVKVKLINVNVDERKIDLDYLAA